MRGRCRNQVKFDDVEKDSAKMTAPAQGLCWERAGAGVMSLSRPVGDTRE